MNLAPMRYKDYVWPHNPETYTISFKRQVAVAKVPFGRYGMQDLGMSYRVMEGEGVFAGKGAYDEFKKLASVFYQGGPGLLIHPVWQSANVYFVGLALAQEPKLLVFDEPTGNLDVANEQRILRQARRLARTRGMTVLCTLHDLNQAMAYGDRLFLMRDGQVRYAGNGDILTPETVWDIFGARVRAAEIDGQKILIGVNEDEY